MKWITPHSLLIDPADDLEAISKSLRAGKKIDMNTEAGLHAYSVGLSAAAKRIGPKPVQRLRWLVELVQLPRESLATDDRWLEVQAFVMADRAFISRNIEDYRPTKLVPVLDQLGKRMRHLVKEKTTWQLDFPANPSAFSIIRKFGSGKENQAFFGSLDAAMAFLFKADETVGAEGRRIQECALPECGRLFVKRKRGIFCRVQCLNRDNLRRWREKIGSTKVNAQQRERYRKKTKSAAKKREGEKMKNRRGQKAEKA
jgi:hypothetical protein